MQGSGGLPRPTAIARQIVRRIVRAGERVVDATVGNGHDTLFLARLVGADGVVTGFDVQAEALERVRQRLAADSVSAEVVLLAASHERLAEHVTPGVAAVMFNLGWLPGGDHALTTAADSTVRAVEAAWHLLRTGGMLTVVAYPGHPGGAAEATAVEEWAARLDPLRARVSVARTHNTLRPAPVLVAVERYASFAC